LRISSDFSVLVFVFDVSHLDKTLRLALYIGFEVGNLCKGNIGYPRNELLHSEHLAKALTPSSVVLALWSLETIIWRGRLIDEWCLEKAPSSHWWKFKLLFGVSFLALAHTSFALHKRTSQL
jgi:hypothetical protein